MAAPDTGVRAPEAPAPLRRDVRILSTILGRAIVESDGEGLLEAVERLRRATIALRRTPSAGRRADVVRVVDSLDGPTAERVARAFTCYFQLANLAEERHRVRELRARSRDPSLPKESIEAAVATLRERSGDDGALEAVRSLRVMPVLTAHPTEARRRTTLETLWRIGELLEGADAWQSDAKLQIETERHLFEEITLLWRTQPVRHKRPGPLDEVRAILALFDETIFWALPAVCRELDRTVAPETGTRPPAFDGVPIRWGSWVGGDRDGHPDVSAETTVRASKVAAEHVLLGLETTARRIARAISVSDRDVPPSPELLRSVARQGDLMPGIASDLRRKLPGMSHRLLLGLCAHRIAATRQRSDAAYASPSELVSDLRTLQASLRAAGADRVAYGELQHLVWQVEAFGFHLVELEVRQHSAVVRAAAQELRRRPPSRSRDLDDTLAVFQAMQEIQGSLGPTACRRFVLSFTRDARDIADVHRLARAAVPDRGFELDVVPLFESRADLDGIVETCDAIADLAPVRRGLARAGAVFEVMLGYSDSAKEVGVLAANVGLYRAQVELVAWAEGRGIELRIFHGRGGALGRGGGPTNRAVLGQPAGSIRHGLKVTEQGEVAFSRYGDETLARRHLEQLANAVLTASMPESEAAARACWDRFGPLVSRMGDVSEVAWRGLVERPGFVDFFDRATPMREIEGLPIGSRPARRQTTRSLRDLRAIPWVFAWGQARVGLPGWFGVGTAIRSVVDEPGGLERLREMHDRWPFFSSFLEGVQLALAKADRQIAQAYLEAAGDDGTVAVILDEFDRTLEQVLEVARLEAPLADRPVLRRAVELRNPYVDALSFLQLRAMPEARAGDEQAARVAAITVSGIAAGLQNTG